jgi:teichuronic acid exporter
VLSSVRKLILGNGLAQGLQLLSLLVLSRLNPPSDFGLLGQVQSIATLACVVATLQLHLAIPLTRTPEEARATAETVQSICLAMFLIALPAALYLGKIFTFAIVLALFLGLANTYTSFLVASGSFGRMSKFYVTRALMIIGLQVGFSTLRLPDGLVWAVVLAEGLAAMYLRLAQFGPVHNVRVGVKKSITLAIELKAFSLYGTVQELMSVCAFYAPLLLFSSKFGDATGGHYSMASRLVWAPVVLLSGSLAQVLYYQFGKQQPVSLGSIYKPVLSPGLAVAIGLTCAVAFGLQDIFLLALGAQWELASRMLPVILLWGAVFLVSTPFRVACRVLRLQRYQLMIDAGMLIAIWALFSLPDLSVLSIMWALVAIAVAQNALLAAAVWRSLSPQLSR